MTESLIRLRNELISKGIIDSEFHFIKDHIEYTGAVEPPVRRTGNRESGHRETDIYETKPLPQRY